MYYCHSCNCEFEAPEIIIETHGLSSPPYEKFSVCPFCRSTDFSVIKVKYCHACGARLYGDNENYCNDSCRLTAKRMEERCLVYSGGRSSGATLIAQETCFLSSC